MSKLEILKGRSKSFFLTVVDQDNTPINIEEATIKFTVKQSLDDTDAAAKISKTTGDGIAITEGVGKCTVSLVPADTQNLECRDYYWDLQIISDSDEWSSDPDEFEIKKVVRND